jgi:signal transduction histidine kinase/CheY-like chemotaxis protein
MTERVLAENSLAAEARRQHRLFQCAPGFIAILRGPEHRFEFVNDAYARLVGEREFLGKTVVEAIPELRDQEFLRLLDEVYTSGQRFVAQQRPIVLRRSKEQDEELYLDFIYEPIVDADGNVSGIFVEGFDATEKHDAETSLREINATLEARVEERSRDLAVVEDALRQAQKMEAIGQLTGGIAHDFNNLLAGITGSLELLNTRLNQGRHAEAERYISAATSAAKRAAALTHRLLAFARRQTLDPRPTDLNSLVSDLEELIRRTVGPDILVEAVCDLEAWTIRVDPNQLENVLLNLCINARDAMPDGGALMIETANRTVDDRLAHELDIPAGQYVSLSVTDNGSGMPPDVIARAFDPFFTTKPIGTGTGLGLSMTYGFARQSGGQVRIYSEVGDGTTICLYLPRHLGEADESDLLENSAGFVRTDHAETVLVVDDEPTVRMLVTDILGELGFASLEAPDGAAGLQVLQSKARIDLLITDVGLPGGINGRQMADAARTSRPDLKVLFITGYAENAVIRHGHLDPGMHVLTKPFSMEALANRINQLLGG